jgi:uncharacterized protein
MKLCLAVLLSIAGTIPAAAQSQPQGQAQQSVPPTSAGQPDPAKIAQIHHLLDVMGITRQGPQMMRAMMGPMQKTMADSMVHMLPKDGVTPDLAARSQKYSALLNERLISKMETVDFAALYVPIYDEYYTLEDINAMIAFYESPVGQKTLQNQTKIAVEAVQAFMPVVMKLTKQAENEVKKEHPELVPRNGDNPGRQ